MPKTYKWILKESYDPQWLDLLIKNNKTPATIEFTFHEKTHKLSKRRRTSEKHIWSGWYHICKHDKKVAECKNCRVKVNKTKKKGLDTTNMPFSERTKKIIALYRSNGKIEYDKKEKRKEYLSSLILYKDTRSYNNKKCIECLKTKVEYENSAYYSLASDETFATTSVSTSRKELMWLSRCVICSKQRQETQYTNGGLHFEYKQIHTIRSHTDKSRDDAKIHLDNLYKLSNNKCFTCNVELVNLGKSGFAQASINKLHPNRPDCKIVQLSCLACNLCQNKLPYIDFLKHLVLIANNNTIKSNKNTLGKNELIWLKRGGVNTIQCPATVRLHVVEKYGRYCVYTGLEVSFESNKFNTASFDRIDSSKPYSNDQVLLVCKHINYVKRGAITEQELIKWITHVRKNQNFIAKKYLERTQMIKK